MTMIKQNSGDVEAIVWRGMAFFRLNRLEVSQKHFKEAVKFDPENKVAKEYLKRIKNYMKYKEEAGQMTQSKRWDEAAQKYDSFIIPLLIEEASATFISKAIANTEDVTAAELNILPDSHEYVHPELYRMHELLCECYVELKKPSAAVKACSSALLLRSDLTDALVFRARARMLEEEYDAAYADLQKAVSIDRNHPRAHSLLQEVQRLQKMQKRVDYYKGPPFTIPLSLFLFFLFLKLSFSFAFSFLIDSLVLGVDKTATHAQIKKAYRKLAVELHPDKAPTDQKEEAAKRMQKLNEAYEVLSDEEKRGKYDRGEDLDNSGGGGGGGHPFGGGFGFPFGGGGFPGGGGQWHFNFRA
jgi:DnaJ family protein C protein 3